MKLPLKPVCSTRWARKDGSSKIYLQYCQSKQVKVMVDSGVCIPPSAWHDRTATIKGPLPSDYEPVEILQQKLLIRLRYAEDCIRYARINQMDAANYLKQMFEEGSPVQ